MKIIAIQIIRWTTITVDKGCDSVEFARGGDRIITKMLLNDVKMREIAKIANNHSAYSDFPQIRPKGKKSSNLQNCWNDTK